MNVSADELLDEVEVLEDANHNLRAEIDRLRAGIKEIDRFLIENRIGDALFVCDALLAGVDEQTAQEK